MVVPPDARSAILNLTASQLEEQIERAENNIKDYEASIDSLNDRIAQQRRDINDKILPGRVYETPLYRQIYGNNREGLQFREGDILAQYQDTIRDENNLIDAAINAINLERAKITNRLYDLNQLRRDHSKPTKSANSRMPQPESKKTKSRSKSTSKGGAKKTNKKGSKKRTKKSRNRRNRNKKGTKKRKN